MTRHRVSAKKIQTIAKKEFKELMREKTFILAIIIQLFIASFSTFLVIGLTSFYDPSMLNNIEMEDTNIAVVGLESDEFYQILLQERNIRPYLYNDFQLAYTDFYERNVDAIIVTPAGTADGTGLLNVDIYLPKSEIKATVVSLQLKEPLERYEQSVRDVRTQRLPGYTPIEFNIIKRGIKATSTYFEFIYVALLPLLVFTPAFISGGLIVDFITEEYERKTMDMLLVTPASMLEIVSGKAMLATLIVPLQSFVWMLLLSMNRVEINNSFQILLTVTIVAFILVMASTIISVLFKDRGVAQLIYSLVLIFLFMSSYLFTNSPLNLVTRLSIESIGALESWTWIGIYMSVGIVLYTAMIMAVRHDPHNI
ncbi:ABC transporter permease [Methanolobus profundi]|uniref:ABC-type Na+ efflux pump, permease component n=1 Tax=Methanolobus profundi TaxID=487685 RepID=A0A1I4RA24_9EURY|nr:ABC transporter permease [Methanolobus profundi]SFM48886.1 ABC-type Na+ efflux pump, permease component [Methanolobus profundi]